MRSASARLLGLLLVFFALPLSAATLETGRYHALVIGNNDYLKLPKLETAVADAEAVAELLTKRYGFAVRTLRNATRTDILRALNQYRAELTEEDNLLIYYAGHGSLDRQTNTGFWQPVDADTDDDLNWISNSDLTRRLNAMTANHVMVVADSCYSGTLVRDASTQLPTGQARDAWLRRMADKRSRTAIVSGGLEPVADSGRGGHSVFANAFLTALEENGDIMEGTALFRQISRPVVVNANQTPQYSDIRQAGHEGGEFLFVPVALRPAPEAAPAKEAPDAAAPVAPNMELAFWQAIQGSDRTGDYEAYLQQFPDGAFAPLARTRLAALRQNRGDSPTELAGKWVSEAITSPFDKNDIYRLHFDFRVVGKQLLGSLTRASTEDSPRKYPATKRSIVDGRTEGATITFQEAFQVLMGSETQDHRRTFTGEVSAGGIAFFLQDTLGNAPMEFTATREKN
ncbi:MAG: caspase family protein [Alphaproteobacteria bacterium]